jgi:hypothetical protein
MATAPIVPRPGDREEAVDPVGISASAVERALARRLLRSIAVAVVVMMAFWTLLVVVALELAARSLR